MHCALLFVLIGITMRLLFSLCLSVPVSVTLCLCVPPSLSLSLSLPLSLSLSLSLSASLCLSLSLSLSLKKIERRGKRKKKTKKINYKSPKFHRFVLAHGVWVGERIGPRLLFFCGKRSISSGARKYCTQSS